MVEMCGGVGDVAEVRRRVEVKVMAGVRAAGGTSRQPSLLQYQDGVKVCAASERVYPRWVE
jgi:hypothetical protein